MNEIVHVFVDIPNVTREQKGLMLKLSDIKWGALYECVSRGSPATFDLYLRAWREREGKWAKHNNVIPAHAVIHHPRQNKDVDAMLIAHMFTKTVNSMIVAPKDTKIRVILISGDTDFAHTFEGLREIETRYMRSLEIEMYTWRASAPQWSAENSLLKLLRDGFCYLDSLKEEILVDPSSCPVPAEAIY